MLLLATSTLLLGVLYVARGAETSFGPVREEIIATNPYEGSNFEQFSGNADDDDTEDEEISQSQLSQTPGELSLAKFGSVVCTSKPPLIEYFVADVIKRIKSCKRLRNAFDIRHFTACTMSAIGYDVVYKSHKKVGSPDAQLSAQIVAQAITATFDKVKKDSLVYIFANSVGNSLYFRDVLKPSNVAAISKKFFDVLKKHVDNVQHPKPEALLRAVGAGFIEYLTLLGQFTAHTTPMLTLAFSKEWYTLCSVCCR